MLLALVTGQIAQSLKLLDINHMRLGSEEVTCTLFVNSQVKQSRPGYHIKAIVLKVFPDDPNVCVIINKSSADGHAAGTANPFAPSYTWLIPLGLLRQRPASSCLPWLSMGGLDSVVRGYVY